MPWRYAKRDQCRSVQRLNRRFGAVHQPCDQFAHVVLLAGVTARCRRARPHVERLARAVSTMSLAGVLRLATIRRASASAGHRRRHMIGDADLRA